MDIIMAVRPVSLSLFLYVFEKMKKKKTPLFYFLFCGWHSWGLGAIIPLTHSHMCFGHWAVGLGTGVDVAGKAEVPKL